MPELRFDDRVAVVTGGGRGVGRSHALLLAARGARVVVADHGGGIDGAGSSAAPADEVAAEIRAAGGAAVACHASVADEEGAASIVAAAIDTYGRLDIVVNNAGIHDAALFPELSTTQFQRMLDVHFFGALFVTRAAWPHFVGAGYGRVVNTVSEAMLGGIPELSSYGSAKGAVFGLTRNLATEGADAGIKVNAVAPRAYTRMSASHSDKLSALMSMPKEVMDQINASMPPEQCAPAMAFLAHHDCPLNGEVLQAGMGGVARIAVVYAQGINGTSITPEDIATSLDQVMDLSSAITSATANIGQ
jgi:NAD(P)-dependent dehydrogenase (short-subunit alcohol dehydrogenase family)